MNEKILNDFENYLKNESNIPNELKDNDFWKGYAQASERILENFIYMKHDINN